jgi:hypothetical protein
MKLLLEKERKRILEIMSQIGESDRVEKVRMAKILINSLASAMLRNNVSDRTNEIKNIISDMEKSGIDWNKIPEHDRNQYKQCMRGLETHLNLWKTKSEPTNMTQGFKLDESKSNYIEEAEQINEIGINATTIVNNIIIDYLNSLVGSDDFHERTLEIAYENTHQGGHTTFSVMSGWKEKVGSTIVKIADERLMQIINAIYKIPEY